MFAVFNNFPQWSWDDLPKKLTNSTHMTLDQQAIAQVENSTGSCSVEMSEEVFPPSPATPTTTGLLPTKTTEGKQVYRLQKSIEESLGQCRTLAFLTSNISTLQHALE